ncbi:hypothetical protein LT679_00240 [Mucilaginibacter roseus]|uniref:Uncharacterized protein n=1 Tax=Mucilaginibacter roseus TaxID=1528868 RepID=A0ABS8U0H4_9SPHI|nr:hypothetical protein [Mucilaginibacter roseus]MCD8739013.1 hypothetical protein [Mucilaginibacter roseus]
MKRHDLGSRTAGWAASLMMLILPGTGLKKVGKPSLDTNSNITWKKGD